MIMSFYIELIANPTFAYQGILFFLSISLLLTSFEEILNKDIYQKRGILSFDISKLNNKWMLNTKIGRFLTLLMNENIFIFLLYLKAICSVYLLILSFDTSYSPWILMLLLMNNILSTLRSPYGLDGAHQLQFMILLSLSVLSFNHTSMMMHYICFGFISMQLILAYFIAGLGKILSPVWRGSYGLLLVFSTNSYGNEFIFNQFNRHRFLTAVLSWSVILFEMSFVGVLLLPINLGLILCFLGIGFHLFNAIFMGLNNFFFTFLSAYPALFFLLCKIHG
jgi:hypothetical protein